LLAGGKLEAALKVLDQAHLRLGHKVQRVKEALPVTGRTVAAETLHHVAVTRHGERLARRGMEQPGEVRQDHGDRELEALAVFRPALPLPHIKRGFLLL
jgi:hypothetical protein